MTTRLLDVLSEVRSRIVRYRESHINEEATKTTLIQPLLRALGWNIEDIDEVHPEYKRLRTDNPVDYALMILREPRLFLEAKALRENLDDPRWANQFISYSVGAGIRWVVLTNGDEYRIYNAYAEVPLERKIFRMTRISDEASRPAETLELLAKERIEKNELDDLWRAHAVDEKVHSTIRKLFSSEGDTWLVDTISTQLPEVNPYEIRASLGRMRIRLEFPEAPRLLAPSPRPPVRAHSESREDASLSPSLPHLIQAGLIQPPLPIQAKYRGQWFSATVQDDGRVVFDGRSYHSLSTAARALITANTTGGQAPERNGWIFWYFRDEDRQRKPMDVLRQLYMAGARGRNRSK